MSKQSIQNDWGFLNKIGAVPRKWKLVTSDLKKLSNKAKSGEALSGNDVKKLKEEAWISEQPFYDEEENPFVLYIYDQSFRWGNDYKFHFCWCSTLEQMGAAGRISRYKAKYDIDNPNFKVRNDKLKKLKVCQNCLTGFDHPDYTPPHHSKAYKKVKEFKLEDFFDKYGMQNLEEPTHQYNEHDYPDNWSQISKQYRKRKDWECEECGRDMSSNKSNLHVHHKNGVKDDNGITGNRPNLQALCKKCHSEVGPYHSFID